MVGIDKIMGRPRRQLTVEDRELVEALVEAHTGLEAAEGRLREAREVRRHAVWVAFSEGIHPLDVAALVHVRRRTVRDWYAQWRAEQPVDVAR